MSATSDDQGDRSIIRVRSNKMPHREYTIEYGRKILCGTWNCTYHCIDCHLQSTSDNKRYILRLGKKSMEPDALQDERRSNAVSAQFNHPNIIHTHDYGDVLSYVERAKGGAPAAAGAPVGTTVTKKGAQSSDETAAPVRKDAVGVFSVLEYCDGGELFEYTRAHWNRSDVCSNLNIMIQLALGLKYIHERGCIHGDLKTENALLTQQLVVKIIDFGYLRKVNRLVTRRRIPSGGTNEMRAPEMFLAKKKKSKLFTRMNSKQYFVKGLEMQIPQIEYRDGTIKVLSRARTFEKYKYEFNDHNIKSIDVYAFGCILFEMVCQGEDVMEYNHGWDCKSPRFNIKALNPAFLNSHPMSKVRLVPLLHLILQMIDFNPMRRLSMAQVCAKLQSISELQRHVGQHISTKRRSTKRRSTKRRSTKRRFTRYS